MTMTVKNIDFDIISSDSSGVESRFLHHLKLGGEGKDDKGEFTFTGALQEVRLLDLITFSESSSVPLLFQKLVPVQLLPSGFNVRTV
jgi:hypothetical protein